jgi:AhpD family alkylhydroperoxidase
MTEATAQSTEAEEILSTVEDAYGFRPNLLQELARAPAAARTYLAGQDAMSGASLSPAQAQAVQLAVAAYNECDYCGAAHTTLGSGSGISEEDLAAIGNGRLPADSELRPVVDATRRVLSERGWLDEGDLAELAEAGVDRQMLYEIIAFVGLKTLSNYVNHIAGTEVDPQFR